MLAAVGLLAPGNALVIVGCDEVGRQGSFVEAPVRRDQGSRRLGQELPVAQGQRAGRLDRARGPRAETAPRAGCGEGDRRSGSAASCRRTTPTAPVPDPQRVDGARQARAVSRHASRSRSRTSGPSSPEALPGSIWAFVDAVGERQTGPALALLERLLAATPEPVLLAVLHRRVRELIELGDRLAGGANLATAARAMGMKGGEYRARPDRGSGSQLDHRGARRRARRARRTRCDDQGRARDVGRTRHSDGWRSRSG